MTTLQYEDSGYRKKQEQKEKEEFTIKFAEWIIVQNHKILNINTIKQLLEIYKEEKGL
jgi:hypothetical protein